MGTRSSPTDLWDVIRGIHRRLSTLETGSGMDWAIPTLVNGWVNYATIEPTYGGARYRRLSNGQVEVQGLVMSGTLDQPVFVLPVGYRPSTRLIFSTMTNPNAAGRLDVTALGEVVASAGSNVWFSLNCTFTPTAG